MTQKKRRMRGSRTHGGGSEKNRRGAGNRGGRGDAGRSKHEIHKHEPLGKHGFKREEKDKKKVEKVNIQEIDETISEIELGIQDVEDIEGIEIVEPSQDDMATDGGVAIHSSYEVNLPQYCDDYEDYDEAKLLNSGQLNHRFNVIADDSSKDAKYHVQSEGGNVYYTTDGSGFKNGTRIEQIITKRKFNNNNCHDNGGQVELLEELEEKVDTGEPLEFHEFDKLVDIATSSEYRGDAYKIMMKHSDNLNKIEGINALNLMRARDFASEYGFDSSEFEAALDTYFSEICANKNRTKFMRVGLPTSLSVDDVLAGLDRIYDTFHTGEYEENPEIQQKQIEEEERLYLFSIDGGDTMESLLNGI